MLLWCALYSMMVFCGKFKTLLSVSLKSIILSRHLAQVHTRKMRTSATLQSYQFISKYSWQPLHVSQILERTNAGVRNRARLNCMKLITDCCTFIPLGLLSSELHYLIPQCIEVFTHNKYNVTRPYCKYCRISLFETIIRKHELHLELLILVIRLFNGLKFFILTFQAV